jgi:hypothetical protein
MSATSARNVLPSLADRITAYSVGDTLFNLHSKSDSRSPDVDPMKAKVGDPRFIRLQDAPQ